MPVWQAVNFVIDSSHALDLSDQLLEAGALSVTISDADAGSERELAQFGEPGSDLQPLWPHADLQVLFSEEEKVTEILTLACSTLDISLPKFAIEILSDSNWLEKSRNQFQPIEISPKLWIVPTWHQAVNPDAINIILDPGMAFGTGSHPTTQMCLLWLCEQVKIGQSVLDYGCGSGILAIAAKKLLAGKVDAIDIDPQAIIAAEENANINQTNINFFSTDQINQLQAKYDLVVANILANPLRVLAPTLCNLVKDGGAIAIAGLLESQAEDLIEYYQPWINLEVFHNKDGWSCLCGRKNEKLSPDVILSSLSDQQEAKSLIPNHQVKGVTDSLLVIKSSLS